MNKCFHILIRCYYNIYLGIKEHKDLFGAALAVEKNNGSLFSCARMRLTKQQRDAGKTGLWGQGAFKSNTGNKRIG